MVDDNKYAIAYSEVLEILKHIPIEDYNKIPKNEIELFEAYADNNYTFNCDTSKTLEEQNVSDITKGIIILLFRDYWATPYQKEIIQEKERQYRQKIEDAKCGFDIFNKKESKKINDEIKEDTSNNDLQIEVKKENY